MRGFFLTLGLGMVIFVTFTAQPQTPEIMMSDTTLKNQKKSSNAEIEAPEPIAHICDQDCRWRLFCRALGEKESNNNDAAIGDNELKDKAHGRYQIRHPFLIDSSLRYDVEEMHDTDKAENVMKAYYLRYQPYTFNVALRYNSIQAWFNLARIHNGGPNGMTIHSTATYGREVVEIMKGLKCNQVVVQ